MATREAELRTRADNCRADNCRADKADHREVVMALLSPAVWAAMCLNRVRRAEVTEPEPEPEPKTELSAAETDRSEAEVQIRVDNFQAGKADHREVVMALLLPAVRAAMCLNRVRRAEVTEPEPEPKMEQSAAETERLDMEMERLDAE
jgi:Na+-transporting methylmalonyl-CoA/oxaloacetate decarboxylase gamma subunit